MSENSDRSARIAESFKRRIDSSAFFEAFVGAQLTRCGLHVHLFPATLAKEIGVSLSYYANTYDLEVSADGSLFTPVEVKSSSMTFSYPNSYPHLGVLVCSEASWNKKWPGKTDTQRDFLLVSRASGGIVWLPKGSTAKVVPIKDKTRNETYGCFATHKSSLKSFSEFVGNIKGEPWEK